MSGLDKMINDLYKVSKNYSEREKVIVYNYISFLKTMESIHNNVLLNDEKNNNRGDKNA